MSGLLCLVLFWGACAVIIIFDLCLRSEGGEEVPEGVRPIRPGEVITKRKKGLFPKKVMEAFNELIIKKFLDGSARFTEEDIVVLILMRMGLASGERNIIYDKQWLEAAYLFRDEGWKVACDKSSKPPIYTFTPVS